MSKIYNFYIKLKHAYVLKKSCNLNQLKTTNLFLYEAKKCSFIHARKGIQINIRKCVKKNQELNLKIYNSKYKYNCKLRQNYNATIVKTFYDNL